MVISLLARKKIIDNTEHVPFHPGGGGGGVLPHMGYIGTGRGIGYGF